ncbi:MAG: FoF1 ATP synthase subunit delta/epsilon [Candidatus Aminicenantales bacterium]
MSNSLPPSLQLKIITPRKLEIDQEVKSVILPSTEGYIQILPGHRPLTVALGQGLITYHLRERENQLSVEGGLATVEAERVTVFTRLS